MNYKTIITISLNLREKSDRSILSFLEIQTGLSTTCIAATLKPLD